MSPIDKPFEKQKDPVVHIYIYVHYHPDKVNRLGGKSYHLVGRLIYRGVSETKFFTFLGKLAIDG